MTLFLFLAWQVFFKGVAALLAVYYTLNVAYDYYAHSALSGLLRNRRADREELVFKMPFGNNEQHESFTSFATEPPQIVPLEAASDDSNSSSTVITAAVTPIEYVEEHSLSVTEFITQHRLNIEKARQVFG